MDAAALASIEASLKRNEELLDFALQISLNTKLPSDCHIFDVYIVSGLG